MFIWNQSVQNIFVRDLISCDFDIGVKKVLWDNPHQGGLVRTIVDVRYHQTSTEDWPPRQFRGFHE